MSSTFSRNTLIAVVIATVVVTSIAVAGFVYVFFPPQQEANVLEIYHWWTSGGENKAVNALVDEFKTEYSYSKYCTWWCWF